MTFRYTIIHCVFTLLFLFAASHLLTPPPAGAAPSGGPEDGKARVISGIASYVGAKFHGRMTANGEEFDMYALTAAHRTLPFGTILRVTNMSNGRSVKVRVNDRGPFVGNRVIDVSYRAAERLGFVQRGLTKVEIEIVQSPSG